MSLRKDVIKLAKEKPELRKHLLPILKEAYDPFFDKKPDKIPEEWLVNFEKVIDKWRHAFDKDKAPYKKDLIKVHREDAKDLTKGLNMLRAGKYEEARRHFEYLDTVVRELVPDNIWDYLHE